MRPDMIVCPLDDMEFPSRAEWKEHLARHEGLTERDVKRLRTRAMEVAAVQARAAAAEQQRQRRAERRTREILEELGR